MSNDGAAEAKIIGCRCGRLGVGQIGALREHGWLGERDLDARGAIAWTCPGCRGAHVAASVTRPMKPRAA